MYAVYLHAWVQWHVCRSTMFKACCKHEFEAKFNHLSYTCVIGKNEHSFVTTPFGNRISSGTVKQSLLELAQD